MDDTSIEKYTEESRFASLVSILDIVLKAGVRLKLSKCSYGVKIAEFASHVVDGQGLKPSEKHVESIKRLVEPSSGDELMRVLNLRTVLLPLLITMQKLLRSFAVC